MHYFLQNYKHYTIVIPNWDDAGVWMWFVNLGNVSQFPVQYFRLTFCRSGMQTQSQFVNLCRNVGREILLIPLLIFTPDALRQDTKGCLWGASAGLWKLRFGGFLGRKGGTEEMFTECWRGGWRMKLDTRVSWSSFISRMEHFNTPPLHSRRPWIVLLWLGVGEWGERRKWSGLLDGELSHAFHWELMHARINELISPPRFLFTTPQLNPSPTWGCFYCCSISTIFTTQHCRPPKKSSSNSKCHSFMSTKLYCSSLKKTTTFLREAVEMEIILKTLGEQAEIEKKTGNS